MKVFTDEDTGVALPNVLYILKLCETDYVSNKRRIKKGTPDEDWLPYVGRQRYLLLSRNVGILESEVQRGILVEEGVGAIFLPRQATRMQSVRLVLNRWEWISTVDSSVPRPFAWKLPLRGRPMRDKRV